MIASSPLLVRRCETEAFILESDYYGLKTV